MHPLLIAVIFTIIAVVLFVVHQKSRHEEVETIDIAKTAILSFGVSIGSIYTYIYLSDDTVVGGASDVGIRTGSGIDQDIMVGNPNF
jgi:hypothetical protein